MREPFDYLEATPSPDAPASDNPSGLYCPDCRMVGASHCANPEECGGMRLMRDRETVFDTRDLGEMGYGV